MSPKSRSRSTSNARSFSRSPVRRPGHRPNASHAKDKVFFTRSRSTSRHAPSPLLSSQIKNLPHCADSRSCSRSPSPQRSRRRLTRSRSPNDRRRNLREKPMQSRCIGVFGLSVYTTQQKIRDIFSKFGPIERIQVVIDAQTGRSRGFCFIYYNNINDAKAAKDACSGIEIDDRRIRVDYSITQRPHSPTPGVYMGRTTRLHRDREYYDREESRYRRPSPSSYNRNNVRGERRRYRSKSRSYSPRGGSRY